MNSQDAERINNAFNAQAKEIRALRADAEQLRAMLASEQQARAALEQRLNTLLARAFDGGATV